MVAAKINTFGGMLPIMDDALLPDMQAAHAENVWLYSGTVIGLPTPQVVHGLVKPKSLKTYRLPAQYNAPLQYIESTIPGAGDTWMEFEHPDTDVIRSPVVDDKFDRYYWASPAGPPMYNTRERIETGHVPYKLGVPAPPNAPMVTPDEDEDFLVTRAYVYTWVTKYDEEGPPSPPTVATGDSGDRWVITGMQDPTDAGMPEYDVTIDRTRIYRTVTGSSGVATFIFVTEQRANDSDYIDIKTDLEIVSSGELPSVTWTPPPEDLEGFVMMPNGIAAGWRNNELWFSEPYRMHAWPVAYSLSVEYPIVGLGVVGQAVVVCTRGFPMTAFGTTPSAITTSKLTLFEPCTSKGSIISAPEGVYYAGVDGLVLVADTAQEITAKLISKDRWQQLVGKTPIRAAHTGTCYYAFGSVIIAWVQSNAFQQDAFQQQDLEAGKQGFMVDTTDSRVAFSLLSEDDPVYNVYNDVWNGEVVRLSNDSVERLNMSDASILTKPAIWRSKKYQTYPAAFGVFKVHFTVPAGTPAPPGTRDYSLTQTLDSKWGLVRWFASYGNDDERHLTTHELRVSGEQMRLPSNAKYEYFWVELETRVRVRDVKFATTVKELHGVP